ncbi:AAA family ATPase, partial [Patescibacteria group bacterium]|nr:AAA family ATPase [Patescibacteria group bacterium]
VAGSRYRGEFEERIQTVLNEIISHQEELVIFVDELHTIIGAGGAGGEGGLDVSNVIKPALARGELHLIGATTLNEYQKYIEKDAALERRFQPIIVAEPTVEQSVEILRGLRDKYEAHHKVKISDEAIVAAVELSDRYVSNRFLPDKAIDLVDQASSRVRIGLSSHSDEMRSLQAQIDHLIRERDYARSHKEYDRAKVLEKRINEVSERKDQSTQEWRKQKGITSAEVQMKHIAQVLSKLTGIPVTELTEAEKKRLMRLEERLHRRVVGQEEAITAVSDAVRRARSGLAERNRPVATFLFLGPTGVGKTELAKTLAEAVFGDESAIVRIDMSEYMEKHAVARMIGSPPGYVGYEEGGQLTEAIRRRPYSVILLDEIEKAHPEVYNLLLQVLDDGRLTDGRGRPVDFTNTVIIATSNIGSDYHQQEKIGFVNSREQRENEQLRERLLEEVRNHFRPEFLNRIDELIVFHLLTPEQVEQIVRLQLDRVCQTAGSQKITIAFDRSVVKYLAEVGYSPEYGARELKRRIQTEIENRLAREMLRGDIKEGEKVKVGYSIKSGIRFQTGQKVKKREKVSV